jgi:molybdopterin/thiamine biosynthesis adenylyltransferase
VTADSARARRFSRQVRFAALGQTGQDQLGRSTALLVGVGALGTHVADALVRAGIGRLVLVDRDVVEVENLQRQILFDDADAAAGTPKAIAAAARLRAISSETRIDEIVADFDVAVFDRLGTRPDVIVDGTDNFATRYLLNDLAIRDSIVWIYGGAVGAHGRAMVVVPGETPCLRCVMPDAPPTGEIGNCETEGILAPVVAQVAAFQTAEALKILSGRRDAIVRGTFVVDVWAGRWDVQLAASRPRGDCRSCALRELPGLRTAPDGAVSLCGRDAVQVRPSGTSGIDLETLAERVRGVAEDVELTPHLLRFRADDCRFSVFRGGRAILFGVRAPDRARTLYDRYVGAP